jgi:hypothetical protein
MTRPQTIDRVALAIRKLTEALIAQDQRQIGVHETVRTAEADHYRGRWSARLALSAMGHDP